MRTKFVICLLIGMGYACVVNAGACDNVMANDELIECLGGELATSDVKLNKTYNALRAKLKSEAKEMFKKAQLAWLSYRDSDCEFQAAAAEGGQAYQPSYIQCQLAKTNQRVKELKASTYNMPVDAGGYASGHLSR